MIFLAQAYHVKWTPAYHNPKAVEQISVAADAFAAAFRKSPELAQSDPGMYNSGWFGLGPAGEAVHLLAEPLQPMLDQQIDDGAGRKIQRRTAWADMFVASRDWHRQNRRQYTNQSMITDLNIQRANRGVAAVDPKRALPEAVTRHYLYESIGLQPWLGSDTPTGPAKPLGSNYCQLTPNGLTRELGYVGYYGEVLDWVARFTTPRGRHRVNRAIRRSRRSLRRSPTRALCSVIPPLMPRDIGPCESKPSWGGATNTFLATSVMASERRGTHLPSTPPRQRWILMRLDTQQMFADNQFFASISENIEKGSGLRKSLRDSSESRINFSCSNHSRRARSGFP